MSANTSAYTALERRYARMSHVAGARGMLSWDHQTMMPVGGADARAEQMATLGVIEHELATDPALPDLFAAAEQEPLDDWQRANLREMRRRWRHATALDADLVERVSRAASAGDLAWRAARPANDFAGFAPALRAVLAVVREVAARKTEALGLAPYDALLDEYEPGFGAAEVDVLFADLERFLPDFLGRALERQRARPAPERPGGPFPVERQRALGVRLMEAVGFDFHHGRLDVSLHPFCGGTPDDVRITTRYDESDFTSALMGVLHETGHAMYERGLPAAWRHQPVGEARSTGMHESQSLLIEMQACRGREFLGFAAPIMRQAFDGDGPAWHPDNLYRLYTRVEPDFIRVDADEVTYPAHVILRYRLERAMIAGDLAVDDLPGAWNDGMKRLLGIVPPTDTLGCLQDIHWADGAFGYFPTYTLGAMAAAQLFAAARRAEPGIPAALEHGDFTPLMAWLRAHVHGQGSLLGAPELMTRATGQPLGVAAFEAHLEARYLS
ncbi:MAG: carboxypeptidase M32 [Alphaproteobacteria bacterium]|nr:carboxypeptidase M32 [Alphaproteobacteria bacterium]